MALSGFAEYSADEYDGEKEENGETTTDKVKTEESDVVDSKIVINTNVETIAENIPESIKKMCRAL